MWGIEARLTWELLFSGDGNLLQEPVADYAGMMEGMEAADKIVATPTNFMDMPFEPQVIKAVTLIED